MPDLRASAIVVAVEDSGNPLLVIRDEYGVLRPVNAAKRMKLAPVVSGNLRRVEVDVLVLEVER